MDNKTGAKVELTAEQIWILQMSDEDIKAGRLISNEQVNEDDLKWLSEISLKPNG